MAGQSAPTDDEAPTERSPLLQNGKPNAPTIHPKDQSAEAAETSDIAKTNQDGEGTREGVDEEDVPLADEPSTSQLVLILSGGWLGSFLAALDSTVVATLTASISTTFNSLSLLSWLASAYFIANAALQPLSGRLTDILSRRTGLLFSNVCFGAGNLICGFATSEWVVIFGRIVAGMGGGGLNAISTFLGSDLVPLRRRGVWQGFGNISYGLGATLGGVLGGWINDTYGWRAAFFIQVPFTVVSAVLVFFNVRVPVKKSSRPTWRRIDFTGAACLIATLVLLLLGVNSGGNVVPWTHPLVLVTLPLSAATLVAFVLVENRRKEPIIPVRLLLHRTVVSACFTNWFLTMSVFAIIFYGPIYSQVRGFTPTQAGLLLIPQSLGTAISSISTGLLMRWLGRYYILSVSLMGVSIAAQALIFAFRLDTPVWVIIFAFFLVGVGYSGMLTTTLLALISAVEHKHQAVITSASYAFRSTGSAIGISVASAVFQNILHRRLWDVLGDQPGGAETIGRLQNSLETLKTLPEAWKGPVQDVYMEALRGVFLTTLGLSVLGAVANVCLKEHVLHKNLARR